MTKKVIIIDDSETQLNLLKVFFEKNYFEVYCAKSAKIGYDMIYDVAPDLIITDALMPGVGGFKFIKMLRENAAFSKIPVIVYSVIPKQSAKVYLNSDFGEYYLKKDENLEELFNFAQEIIQKHPVDLEYKNAILNTPLFSNKKEEQEKTNEIIEEQQKQEIEEILINEDELSDKLKKIYSHGAQDEKILKDLFKILYPILKYSVFMVDIFSFSENKRKLYFDIRNVILSPIFQNALKKEYRADEVALYKKYAPNLKTIKDEKEFLSKIEFKYFFKEQNIANIAFWSVEDKKYDEIQNLEQLKNLLFNFFCVRYINKYIPDKKDKIFEKYSNQSPINSFLKLFEVAQPRQEACLGIIRILNFNSILENNTDEDLDILNLKISQNLLKLLGFGESVFKASQNEYDLLLFAKSKEELEEKLKNIYQKLSQIQDGNEDNLGLALFGINCTIDDELNPAKAREELLESFEEVLKDGKILVK